MAETASPASHFNHSLIFFAGAVVAMRWLYRGRRSKRAIDTVDVSHCDHCSLYYVDTAPPPAATIASLEAGVDAAGVGDGGHEGEHAHEVDELKLRLGVVTEELQSKRTELWRLEESFQAELQAQSSRAGELQQELSRSQERVRQLQSRVGSLVDTYQDEMPTLLGKTKRTVQEERAAFRAGISAREDIVRTELSRTKSEKKQYEKALAKSHSLAKMISGQQQRGGALQEVSFSSAMKHIKAESISLAQRDRTEHEEIVQAASPVNTSRILSTCLADCREAVATALGVGASSIEGVDWDADEAVVFSIPQARRVALLRKIRAAVAAFDNLTDSKRRAVPQPVQLGFARNASCIAMIAEFAQMPDENARAERVRGSRDARQEAREFARRGSTVALQQKNLLPKLAVGRVTGTD